MQIDPTNLAGVHIITPSIHRDDRGTFLRTRDPRAMERAGLRSQFDYTAMATNHRRGTLRGMHLQAPPHGETKLVSVTRGRIVDVALDLRPDSPTFAQHVAVELSQENRRMLYIPPGVAHGYVTLEDDSDVAYQMQGDYAPQAAIGIRHDDPAFAIRWPIAIEVINERDANYELINLTELRARMTPRSMFCDAVLGDRA